MIKTSLNNGLKLATNSVAAFQTQRPAKSSEVFEGWLPRIVGGSLARPLWAVYFLLNLLIMLRVC
jgi:hypothetical protein